MEITEGKGKEFFHLAAGYKIIELIIGYGWSGGRGIAGSSLVRSGCAPRPADRILRSMSVNRSLRYCVYDFDTEKVCWY
ncbi:hypothetical protein BEI60_06285 [Eisenbergiella tayi]|nr:hypothetical protein BEI60_06285 [Eisenbergiella tayi]